MIWLHSEASWRMSLGFVVTTMFKASCHRAPHVCVTHRKPLGTAKAMDPEELLMVLAPSVGSSKGHYKESFQFI